MTSKREAFDPELAKPQEQACNRDVGQRTTDVAALAHASSCAEAKAQKHPTPDPAGPHNKRPIQRNEAAQYPVRVAHKGFHRGGEPNSPKHDLRWVRLAVPRAAAEGGWATHSQATYD
jgi:hypothetical protein